MSNKDMYKKLPGQTMKKCCNTKDVPPEVADGFLPGFLNRYISTEKLQRDNTIEKLKFKTIPLTAKVKRSRAHGNRVTKRKSLTSKQKKELQVFKISPEDQRYDLFQPLHQLWMDYIQDIVNFDRIHDKNEAEVEQKLLKADYHGSEMKVTQTKCASLLGQEGIMVRETKNTWVIICKDNKLKTIPKQSTVMSIEVAGYRFSIHGHNFRFKSSERSSRRFKGYLTRDM